jgi:hypothetical protein
MLPFWGAAATLLLLAIARAARRLYVHHTKP